MRASPFQPQGSCFPGKARGQVGARSRILGLPPQQVAIYREEEDTTLARQEVEGGGTNYVHREGTRPDQHQALILARSSRHLPRAGRDLWGLSAGL